VPPKPLLPSLDREQQKIEAAVVSSLAEFVAIVKKLPLYPRRLLLILFEYRWAVRLYGERKPLGKAINSMERALKLRERRRGHSVKDMDALDEIWWLIERDREQRRKNAFHDVLTQGGRRGGEKRTILPSRLLVADWLVISGSTNVERAVNICRKRGISLDHAETLLRRMRRLWANGLPRLIEPDRPKSRRKRVSNS